MFASFFLSEDSTKKHPFPCPSSYRTALTYYLDITSNPRTHVLKELAEYASDVKVRSYLGGISPSWITRIFSARDLTDFNSDGSCTVSSSSPKNMLINFSPNYRVSFSFFFLPFNQILFQEYNNIGTKYLTLVSGRGGCGVENMKCSFENSFQLSPITVSLALNSIINTLKLSVLLAWRPFGLHKIFSFLTKRYLDRYLCMAKCSNSWNLFEKS